MAYHLSLRTQSKSGSLIIMLSLSLSRSFKWSPANQHTKGCANLALCVVGGLCLRLLNSSADLLEQSFLLGSVIGVWCSSRAESLTVAFGEP